MADPQDFKDRVVGALGAVIAVALVIGVVIGVVTYAAVKMSGLTGGDGAQTPAAEPAAPASTSASDTPTEAETPAPASPSASTSPTRDAGDPKDGGKSKQRKHDGSLTLSARPQHVGSMDRIDLSGRYPGHDGTNLAVQRYEGGRWGGFPVSATVRNGRFSTWVASGQSGKNKFRVVDSGSGHTSPAVTVIVG